MNKGDYIFIQHCGAYCYAISNHFNGRYYKGMVKVSPNGLIELCNEIESEFLSSVYLTYNWEKDFDIWQEPKTINLDIVNDLNSKYLQNQSLHKSYEIVLVKHLSENSFELCLEVNSNIELIDSHLAPSCVSKHVKSI
mgnify:CR=1 FL=1